MIPPNPVTEDEENDISAREEWSLFLSQGLNEAYGEDEPEYTLDMIKEWNPDYRERDMAGTSVLSEPLHIGKIVRNARVFNFKDLRRGSVSDGALFDAVDRIFELLEERGIEHLLVGGAALLYYVDGRSTEKIDLILAASSLDQIPEIRDLEELQIDLLLTSNPLFEEVRRRYATRQRFAEREIPCATPEGLVLLKLYALPSLYRQGNLARVALYETDILMLLDRHKVDIEPLLSELEAHLSPTDLASLRGITDEIRQRIERFGGQFR
jgi:hypothetical protein